MGNVVVIVSHGRPRLCRDGDCGIHHILDATGDGAMTGGLCGGLEDVGTEFVLGDMAANEVDKIVELSGIGSSDGGEKVIKEALVELQDFDSLVVGDLASFVILVILDAVCVVRDASIARLTAITL